MTNPLVVDISHWQSKVDFNALKAAGTIGVILKATQDVSYLDNTYIPRNEAALRAGLCTAPYHYLTKGDIVKQMQFFVNKVVPDPGSRLIIDYEDKGLVVADLELAVKTLMDLAPDREITVYGANGFLGAQLNGRRNDLLANNTSLWVASYTTAPSPTVAGLKGTWPRWSLWQYSQDGIVDGVTGKCDVNRWNGEAQTLAGWFHIANLGKPMIVPTPAPQPPAPEQPEVMLQVDAIYNGKPVKALVSGKVIG